MLVIAVASSIRNDGEWTEGRYRSFITSTLRGGMRRWPPKWKALKEAEVGRKTNKKTGKLAMHYKCASCGEEFTSKDVEVDHKEPVVELTGFVSWDVYIDRLFCEKSNLQILCKSCHKVKTKEEKNDAKRISTTGETVSTTRVKQPRVSGVRSGSRSGGGTGRIRKSSKGQSRTSPARAAKKRAR